MSENNITVKLYDDDIGHVSLVQSMGDELTIVNSARVSFGVEKQELDSRDRKLIKYLIKHRHTSTLEHNFATFLIEVPLFIRSQHHRHRTWSYNEISRRYTDYDMKFYYPTSFRMQSESNRQASTDDLVNPNIFTGFGGEGSASDVVREHCNDSLELYEKLIKGGVSREQARMILPQNLYTKYYATANLNNILKFIDLRIHEGAQWEIQQLAKGMLEIIVNIWPFATNVYREINNH
jgi:thymidylate synthase (FAD)